MPAVSPRYKVSRVVLDILGGGSPGRLAAQCEEAAVFDVTQTLCRIEGNHNTTSTSTTSTTLTDKDGFLDLCQLAEKCVPDSALPLWGSYKRTRDLPSSTQKGEKNEIHPDESSYLTIVERLKCCASDLHSDFESLAVPRALRTFPKGVIEVVITLMKGSRVDQMVAFMLCVSYLERALTAVLVWGGRGKGGGGAAITLRETKSTDLLQNEFLKRLLGVKTILLFRALFGPLHGLSLRNLVWHNFLSAEELHPSYAVLLLHIILSLHKVSLKSVISNPHSVVSIGDILYDVTRPFGEVKGCEEEVRAECFKAVAAMLQTKPLIAKKYANALERFGVEEKLRGLPERISYITEETPFVLMDITAKRASAHKGGPLFDLKEWTGGLKRRGIDLTPTELTEALLGIGKNAFLDLVANSAFFLSSRENEWGEALEAYYSTLYLEKASKLSATEGLANGGRVCMNGVASDACSVYKAAALVSVLLESALRRVYAAVNDLDHRWRAPIKDELFVTVDEILSPGANHLLPFLGNGATDVLYDHWIWQDGPRGRDDLAHASIHPEDIPVEILSPLLAVVIHCGVALAPPEQRERFATTFATPLRYVANYHTQMAPQALFNTESALFQTTGRAMITERLRLIELRGTGFPPPSGGSSGVDVAGQNERIADDPNRLPDNARVLRERLEKWAGGVQGMEVPAVTEVQFVGKVANVAGRCFVRCSTLRKIVAACEAFTQRVSLTYDAMYTLVFSRRAYKKQRIVYARLLTELETLADMTDLAFSFAQVNAACETPNGDMLRERCLNFMHSLVHQAELKQWSRCLPEYTAFTAALVEMIEKD